MSRTFRHLFLPSFAKGFLEKYPIQTIGIGTVCHLGYTLGTKCDKDIVVARKYQYDVYGFTNFMVVDTTGNHYNVNNSFWFMKWNSIEEWSNIEPNDSLTVGLYGWRIPSLGTFPNIVSTKKNTVPQIIHVQTEVELEPRIIYFEK